MLEWRLLSSISSHTTFIETYTTHIQCFTKIPCEEQSYSFWGLVHTARVERCVPVQVSVASHCVCGRLLVRVMPGPRRMKQASLDGHAASLHTRYTGERVAPTHCDILCPH